jgi:ABC-type amino acid transport substrate-binding protein
MNKLQKSLIVLLVTLGFVFAKNCLAADPAPLKVGITPKFPPVIFRENSRIAGVEADFARAMGEALGRPVQFVEVGWEDQIPALMEGRTDIIMSGMSVTRARELPSRSPARISSLARWRWCGARMPINTRSVFPSTRPAPSAC